MKGCGGALLVCAGALIVLLAVAGYILNLPVAHNGVDASAGMFEAVLLAATVIAGGILFLRRR